jgi:hypothetical protein
MRQGHANGGEEDKPIILPQPHRKLVRPSRRTPTGFAHGSVQ